MLVLSRRKGETLVISGGGCPTVKVTVVEVVGYNVRIGIEAPKEVRVVRSELVKQEE